MFRLRSLNSCFRRLLHVGTVNRDQVLEQLQVCVAEDQLFDVVGKNKAKLTVDHVSCAVGLLWQFHKEKPELLRNLDLTRTHPQFLTLRVLAENKIAHMDDFMLINMLYDFMRLDLERQDSVFQQLVSEAWLRIDSPLMGHITSIVDQKLPSIDDSRALSALMISISPLVSPQLRDALISKVDQLLDNMGHSEFNTARRIVQFLRNMKYLHRPILEKCNKIILSCIPTMDVENIHIVFGLYQSLQFNSYEFKLAAKQRLTELIDSTTDSFSFTKLFVNLAPMASPPIRERMENTALLLADEFSAHQAFVFAEALEQIQSKNLSLLNKVASVIQRNLHVYRPVDLARITQALYQMYYYNPELFSKLRKVLVNSLQRSFLPYEVTILTRVLALVPGPLLEEVTISRVDAMVEQCRLSDLNTVSLSVAKWIRNDPSYQLNTHSKYDHVLQTLNRCGHQRLQTADRLDLVLEELKFMTGDWFEEMLLEETMAMLQRMMDQINWSNVPELSLFIARTNHLCPPLMDRIASVTIEHIDKIHPAAIYGIMLSFSVLNYDPVQADEVFNVCIKRLTPHISSFEPHLLVLVASCLAVVDRFPEELIREIFSIDFLGKLDSQLETLPEALSMRTRQRLMELNRAVCLECPEFQVPWFHGRYCQQLQRKMHSAVSPVQKQIYKILGDVFGGINYVQVAVTTPYYYTVDFECKLDKHSRPLPYSESNTLQVLDRGEAHWDTNSLENGRDELPPGAQRVAVEFLSSRFFCKNSHHMKGETLMRKRHLEILGYRVVQIPHFEWNSMELSTHDAWQEYLKKKIFG
ncbi:FAST kinase domain-containing protein 1, mitochondrial isoform X2 [Stegastes partitus]|uniref:FAST kinase domain-containing protein 1, mitochondrial isoform X2 n=1 Tax=Stegastes partitus TaxID=144197 RepID=A0A9Y4JJ42_9TELE|nr:PREDICTED: FAST kinase domain-containing protein 1 isoform X2 [Stegastes partitus]